MSSSFNTILPVTSASSHWTLSFWVFEQTPTCILFLTMHATRPVNHSHSECYIQTNSLALSPQANYTDWSTATCRRNLVPTFEDRGVSRGQRGGSPTVVNLSFLDRSRYFSFKYLLIYSYKVWVDPVPDPLPRRKSGIAVNRTRDLWDLWPLDYRGDHIAVWNI
jgi:hypothetical protein